MNLNNTLELFQRRDNLIRSSIHAHQHTSTAFQFFAQFAWRTLSDDFTLLDDNHPVTDLFGFTQNVGTEQHRMILAQFPDQIAQFQHLNRI